MGVMLDEQEATEIARKLISLPEEVIGRFVELSLENQVPITQIAAIMQYTTIYGNGVGGFTPEFLGAIKEESEGKKIPQAVIDHVASTQLPMGDLIQKYGLNAEDYAGYTELAKNRTVEELNLIYEIIVLELKRDNKPREGGGFGGYSKEFIGALDIYSRMQTPLLQERHSQLTSGLEVTKQANIELREDKLGK